MTASTSSGIASSMYSASSMSISADFTSFTSAPCCVVISMTLVQNSDMLRVCDVCRTISSSCSRPQTSASNMPDVSLPSRLHSTSGFPPGRTV